MGTLDPFASGVLILGIGSAARLNQFLNLSQKGYEVEAVFGKTTNTYDIEGEVQTQNKVPECIGDKTYAKQCLADLVGELTQKPPAFSAIKINGKPAYKSARAGKDVDMPERKITVYDAKLLSVSDSS